MEILYRPRKASGWALYLPAHLIGKAVKGVTGRDVTAEITELIKWADDNNHHIIELAAKVLKH